MKPLQSLTASLVLIHLAGCNPLAQPAPVTVQGQQDDIHRLAGTWRGEFHNAQTGRVGEILLQLRADSDTAHGRVTFNRVVPITTCTDMSHAQEATSIVVPVVLRLGGLATADGSVGGWLQPYRDPDLGCWMDAWFRGRLTRDTLRGTFFSRRTDIDTVRAGEWWAARVN